MGPLDPRGSRRITWVTPNHGLRDAPQQVLHGVSFVESLPEFHRSSPNTATPCSQFLESFSGSYAAVSYIEGVKKKKGLVMQQVPAPREECEITELTSSLAFRSLRSLSL